MASETNNLATIRLNDCSGARLVTATLTGIDWERIIMHLTLHMDYAPDFDPSVPLEFYLVTAYYKPNGRFQAEQLDEQTYRLTMNVTNPSFCSCVPTGTYALVIIQGNNILGCPTVADELAPHMADKSRTFLHNNKTKGYCVNIACSETEEALNPVFTIMDMSRSGLPVFNAETRPEMMPSRRKKLNKRIDKFKRQVMLDIYNVSNRYYKTFRPKKPVITFMSEQDDRLGTNLTALIDRIKARGLEDRFTLLESARATVAHPHQGTLSWVKMLVLLARTDMLFLDDHAPVLDWLKLDPKTDIIQLWHAGAGFKSSGYSRWGHTGCPAPVSCHRQYKYGVAASKTVAGFHAEVWGINPEQVLPAGMPRMDEFLDPDYRKSKTAELKAKFPMINGNKVLLFAPTYRGKNRFDAHYPYDLIDFDRLYDWCTRKGWIVLFKMHPWVAEPVPIKDAYKDRFVDANTYPNINDLLYVTNLLITDYSSCIFEYSLMHQPALFFAFDEIQYEFSRGFHRDYEDAAPGKICHTFEEVLAALETEDFDFHKIEQYAKEHFDYTDPHACDRIIDWILLGNIPAELQARIDYVAAINERLRVLDFSAMAPEEAGPLKDPDDEDEEQTSARD